MATKGIEITSSVTDETKTSGSLTKIFAKITGFNLHINDNNSLTVEIFVKYHRTEAASDGEKIAVSGWPSLKPSYIIEITEAGGSSVLDALYNKLKTAMEADHATLTKINK